MVQERLARILGRVAELGPREPAGEGQQEDLAVDLQAHLPGPSWYGDLPRPVPEAFSDAVPDSVPTLAAVLRDGDIRRGVPVGFLVPAGHDVGTAVDKVCNGGCG